MTKDEEQCYRKLISHNKFVTPTYSYGSWAETTDPWGWEMYCDYPDLDFQMERIMKQAYDTNKNQDFRWHYVVMKQSEMIGMRNKRELPYRRQYYSPMNFNYTPQEALRHYMHLVARGHEALDLGDTICLVVFVIYNETMKDKFGFFNRHYLESNDYLKDEAPLPLSYIEFHTMGMWELNGNTLQKIYKNYL